MRRLIASLLLVMVLAIAAPVVLAEGTPDLNTTTNQAEVRVAAADNKAGDPTLPSSELLKPILPDLSKDSVPGRALRLGQMVLGGFGFGILLFGVYRLMHLAYEAMSGKKVLKALAVDLALYGIAFALVFGLLGGSMYSLLVAVYEFVHHAASA